MLDAIASFYEDDPRLLAVAVFGSLGRGDWDEYSDLDLDVVTAEGVRVEVEAELARLGGRLAETGEEIALLIPGPDDADVVFKSGMELSIRYHPLSSTSPDIVDSLRLLTGRIDRAAIEAAGRANRDPQDEPLERDLDRCVRHALEADNALRRGRLWSAIELLHHVRRGLMSLFTGSRGGARSYQFFEKHAGPALQARLGGTLPQYDFESARACLEQVMDILVHDLDRLTEGRVRLAPAQSELLNAIRSREEGPHVR
jgi:predicted nucleotidyltransferase